MINEPIEKTLQEIALLFTLSPLGFLGELQNDSVF